MSGGFSLRGDTRAVSAVLGALLLVSLFVTGLAVYQAEQVPAQNAETEYAHTQTVHNDLTELYRAIHQASQSTDQYVSVTLGTRYRPRIVAINPPPVVGTIQTHRPQANGGNISIYHTGVSSPYTVSTSFIRYHASYEEIPADPVWYETSVLYVDGRDVVPSVSSGVVLLEQRSFLTESRLIAVDTAGYYEQGVERTTIRVAASQPGPAAGVPDGESITAVHVPTRLAESTWEDEILSGVDDSEVTISGARQDDGTHTLVVTDVPTADLEASQVGIETEPTAPAPSRDQPIGGSPPETIEAVQITDSNGTATTEFTTGEDVQFAVTISNTGTTGVTHTVSMDRLRGVVGPGEGNEASFSDEVETKQVTVAPGDSETVRLIWPDAKTARPNTETSFTITISTANTTYTESDAFVVAA